MGELIDNVWDIVDEADEEIGWLEIEGHSSPFGFRIGDNLDWKQVNQSRTIDLNRISELNAVFAGGELDKLPFACPCTILLTGCYSGLKKGADAWPQVLADQTGCLVKGTGGTCRGSVFSEDFSKDIGGYDDNVTTRAADGRWHSFMPKKRRVCGAEEAEADNDGQLALDN